MLFQTKIKEYLFGHKKTRIFRRLALEWSSLFLQIEHEHVHQRLKNNFLIFFSSLRLPSF